MEHTRRVVVSAGNMLEAGRIDSKTWREGYGIEIAEWEIVSIAPLGRGRYRITLGRRQSLREIEPDPQEREAILRNESHLGGSR